MLVEERRHSCRDWEPLFEGEQFDASVPRKGLMQCLPLEDKMSALRICLLLWMNKQLKMLGYVLVSVRSLISKCF